jgi:two-component system response regulator
VHDSTWLSRRNFSGPLERLYSSIEFEGHWLGLATLRRIAARHGGRIWTESTAGRGVTFSPWEAMMVSEPVILLVEDNDDDAELTVLAFDRARIRNPVVRARDGVEALDYLFARGCHASRAATLPAVVLLDLNLPRLGGLEVLRSVRADERTRHLPVVILTSSDRDSDRLVYNSFPNSYARKPVNHEQLVAVARELGLCWLLLHVPSPHQGV